MITFLTLFLGLTFGPQAVELAVEPTVAAVELRLDGELERRVEGPPWTAEVTFGPDLGPWLLEAVAFDAEGAEVGRAERWVNLGSGGRAARLWLRHETAPEEGGPGPVTGARLAWRSVAHDRYRALEITFDGEPLRVEDPDSFPLPPHDPGELHLLTARVTLPDGGTLRADAAFGGSFGEEISSELTAVPVDVDGRRRLLDAGDAGQDWLRVDGRPHPVLAVDRGGADLYAVLDPSADLGLKTLGYWLARKLGVPAQVVRVERDDGGEEVRLSLLRRPPGGPEMDHGLGPDDRLFLVSTERRPAAAGYHLFGVSHPLLPRDGGTSWQLTYSRLVGEADAPDGEDAAAGTAAPETCLAEAVAVAGLRAAEGGRPRAVLLILGPRPRDASRFDPAAVRRYLDRLRVPLHVWVVEPGRGLGRRAADRLAPLRERWGDDLVEISTLSEWLWANERLGKAVARQRILWIDGTHPPESVKLAGAPKWLRPVVEGGW